MSRADDHVAVRRLLDAYADVVCRRDWDELPELFHPEVAITIAKAGSAPIEVSGPEAFASFVDPAMAGFEFFLFQILNARIDFTGEHRATSRLFMSEIRQSAGEFSQVYGRYDDTFRRIDGRWWFVARHYRTLARTTSASVSLEIF
jgi:hypothetical protein